MLEEIKALKEPQRYAICREEHQDGSHHLHALLCYDRKVESANERFFDIRGFHPNIVTRVQSITSVYNYIIKDGEYIANFNPTKRGRFDIEMEDSENKEEYLNKLKQADYQAFVVNYDRINAYAEKLYTRPSSPLKTFGDFNIPLELSDWVQGNLSRPRPHRPRSLILVGGTRLGKTEWARSLGEHTYWNNAFSLDTWKRNGEYVVIDDIEWQYVPSKKSSLGGTKRIRTLGQIPRENNIKTWKSVYTFM